MGPSHRRYQIGVSTRTWFWSPQDTHLASTLAGERSNKRTIGLMIRTSSCLTKQPGVQDRDLGLFGIVWNKNMKLFRYSL